MMACLTCLDDEMSAVGVALFKLIEHVDLEPGRLAVFGHIFDHLQRQMRAATRVPHLDHLAERAFAQCAHNFIYYICRVKLLLC